MKNKRWIALMLVLSTLICTPYLTEFVFATSATDKKEEAESELEDVNSEITDIGNNQQQTADKIAATRKKLSNLLDAQEVLGKEIDATNEAIATTQKELKDAKETEAKQYEAMVLRIQYMYENSAEDSIWEALLKAEGLTDLLNRVEYIAQIHKTDRELTLEYQATVDTIIAKQEALVEQMETLLAKEEVYLGQQLEIETTIASLEADQTEFAAQLAAAKKKADKLKDVIAEQERIIEEERKRAEEEARRKAEEEAKKKAEAEAEALKNSVTGSKIVAYARQFVGNPYVWGGNSLTKGCDCSGFVHLIFKHFGFNLPRYSMSFLNVGTPVKLEDIQVGDIVIYNKVNGIGHVAIYIGNGKIVEAQSSAAGITDTRSVSGRSIAGIRRIVNNP